MAVNLVEVKYFDEFSGTGGTGADYIIGCVGDKARVELTFEVEWKSVDVPMTFASAAGVNTITRTDSGSFIDDGFKDGDIIEVSSTTSNDGTKNVLKVTDLTMTVTTALTTETSSTTTITGVTVINDIDYYFNLIENDAPEDYHSLVDRDTQQRFRSGVNSQTGTTAVDMIVSTNSKGWYDDYPPSIVGVPNSTTGACSGSGAACTVNADCPPGQTCVLPNPRSPQRFKIAHEFIIKPLFLNGQLSNFQNGLPPAPEYFGDRRALKYIAKIDAKFTRTDPEVPHTSAFDLKKGNTAWFNEFLNGEEPTYRVDSIAYTDTITGATLTALQYCRKTNVQVNVTSLGGKFSNSATKLVLHHAYMPLEESDYINTRTSHPYNFRYDRASVTLGSAGVNGEKLGTAVQAITALSATYISATQARLNFTIDYTNLLNTTNTFIDAKDAANRNYFLAVTTQDDAITTYRAMDRNAVLADVNILACNKDEADLFVIIDYVRFYEHPDEVTNHFTNMNMWERDGIYSRTQFFLKSGTGAKINSLELRIEAVHPTEDSFTLESKIFDLTGFRPDRNGVQDIDISEEREFVLLDGDPRKRVSFRRLPALDIVNYSAYEIDCGFKFRWETWRDLFGASDDFPEAKENWARYSDDPDWSVQFNVYASVERDDNVTDFIHKSDLGILAEGEQGDAPVTVTIETFTDDEVTNLDGNILTDDNTLVKATFTGDFSSLGTGTTGYYGILFLDNETVGGTDFEQECSSVVLRPADSIWLDTTGGAGVATLTVVDATTITLKAVLSAERLKSYLVTFGIGVDDVMIAAHLGLRNEIALLLQENGFPLLQENGEGIEI